MPKKLSSAVVGTLAVGLTLPAAAAAAQATTAPADSPEPQPLTGAGDSASSASSAAGMNISTARTAQTFSGPLVGQVYTYSTGQGPRCISLQGASTSHQGQDLLADEGTPFSAISDGTVVRTVEGTESRAGFVVLRHNIGGQVYHSGYLHVWDAESHVSVGDSVRAGQTIGLVGDSGPTIAPHLHLEIWKGGWHTGTVLDPAEWLAERGVDLREAADRVQDREVPSSCDYYAAESTPLRASAGSDAEVLTQLPRGAELTSAPGDSANGLVRVTGNGQTGWVQLDHLTPERPGAAPAAATEPAGSGSPATASSSEGQHRVTEPLYARSGPGTNHPIRQGMPTGEQVTVTAVSGDWMQFTRRGEQVWSHGAYLERLDGTAETSGASSAVDSPSAPASSSGPGDRSEEAREVTTALNVRSGAGTSHAVVGGMPVGEKVTVVSTSGDWVQIRRANGQQGWAHGAYLAGGASSSSQSSSSEQESSTSSGSSSSSSSTSTESSSSSSGTHRVTVGLNLRSGAGSSNAVVGGMPAGERVTAVSTSGDWVQVRRANGQQGWAHGAYLAGGSPSSTGSSSSSSAGSNADGGSASSSSGSGRSSSAASTSSGSSNSSASASDEASTTAWVNMRSGAGMSHGVQRTVAPSTGLKVLDQSRGWYQVKVGDHTGWIWQDYLDVPDSAAGQAPASESSASSSTDSSSGSSSSSSNSSGSSGSSSNEESNPTETADSNGAPESSASSDDTDSAPSTTDTRRVTAGLNLRSGAGESSPVVGGMAAGEQVSVVSTSGDWVQVRRAGGQQGWAHGAYLAGGSSSSGSSSSSSSSSSGSGSSADSDDSSSTSSGSTSAGSSSSNSGSSGSSGSSSGSGSSGSSGSSSSSSSSGSGSSNGSGSSPAGSSSSDSDSSDSTSGSSGNDSADSGGSGTGGSTGGSNTSSGRSGPSSGQHAQSSHGPYSSVWDRLAQCESTGNWSINTGNGYYGGVQFSKQSWEAVGGSGLPHQASKQEQIERAYALWKLQGWGAWPSCTSQLGLSGDPGGWGDSYFDVHGGTESASTFAAAGQWTASYSVPLREDPSTSSEKLVQIPRGAVLEAGDRSGSWIQVQFTHEGEELTGWVNTRYITAA